MAWTDLSSSFGFETVLTDTQMQNLRDNIAAAFAKDSGAPTLASNYITETMIDSFAITETKIDSGAITTSKFFLAAVDTNALAIGAVDTNRLDTEAVTSAKIGALAVTESKVDSWAITAEKISDNSIGTVKLHDGAITSDKLGYLQVTEAKINTSAVTGDKIQSSAINTSKIGSLQITESKINSGAVTEYKIGSAAVAQAKLKTSTGEVSTTAEWGIVAGAYGEIEVLPGGEYGFYPQIKCTSGDVMATMSYATNEGNWTAGLSPSASYATVIRLGVSDASSGTAYAQQRYITSSGEVFWVFIARDKITKEILSTYAAPDHPCFGNGGDPNFLQHPFLDIIKKENDKLFYKRKENREVEILVINPDKEKMFFLRKKIREEKQDIVKTIYKYFDIIEDNLYWPKERVTVGLPDDFDWYFSEREGKTEIVKMIIPKPDYIISAKTKLKRSNKDNE